MYFCTLNGEQYGKNAVWTYIKIEETDYLERTYGNYMTLLPVEQRVTHNFKAYWL